MKAATAGYVRATSLSHAVTLLAASKGQARLLAGGQSLVAAMNLRLAGETALIDINGLSELGGITADGAVLRIGALTRHRELATSPLVASLAPAIAQAAPLIAHAAIRTRGTIGGSLAYADPAAELPACMLALGATIVVAGPQGLRRVAAEDFFVDLFTTALAEDEMITAVEVPFAEPGERQATLELARRSGDYALAGIVLARKADGPRIAFFGVGPTARLARSAMAVLASGGDGEAAAAVLDRDLDPPDDVHAPAAVRLHLARVLLRRALAATQTGDA
ncbi:FAD binding domain-containing protein [Polymorphum gilvum]|uniref:Putative carbon monoxide dehydrogenase medium subunit, coxM-like protein n=1 Tax=Polymorphum gilvum (strain LMG 25793 / CGMCC 1.9160 / SL003B-26A1) TaxID=991905 RepID=F2J2K8_POLGS|nr:FAD binding domain-containing protein [Polymorphum gilvum]ADZ70922.1 Putative carbon monoxide dehydrogenase medium subunit, coxM-like protein [Polymorphum gilvum SL003B-26A1]